MTDPTTRFIGNVPQHYDRYLAPVIFVDFAADMARRAAAVRPARVLEIAAGTGVVTRLLRDLLPPETHLTATGLNPPMLDVARAKFRPGEQINFQAADAAALPFPDGAFDLAVCQFGIMFFPDKDKSYRAVRRVLAPHGRYIFSVWDSHRRNPFGQIAHEVLGSFFPADPLQYYQVPFGYCRIDPIKESLIEAGFYDIKIAVLNLEKEIPDAAAFARGLIFGNPPIEQIRARGLDPEEIVDALTQALRREFAPTKPDAHSIDHVRGEPAVLEVRRRT